MIRWFEEGQPLKQGFSFYRPGDKSSLGVKVRFGRHMWILRYSKCKKQWMCHYMYWSKKNQADYDLFVQECGQ